MKIKDFFDTETKGIKKEFFNMPLNEIDCHKITEDIDDINDFEFKCITPEFYENFEPVLGAESYFTFEDGVKKKFYFSSIIIIINNPKQFPKASKVFTILYLSYYKARLNFYKKYDELYNTLSNEEKLKVELLSND